MVACKLAAERSRSYQAFANVHTAAGGLDPLAAEDDDSPPHATATAAVVSDRVTPPPQQLTAPAPEHIDAAIVPDLSRVDPSIIPPQFATPDIANGVFGTEAGRSAWMMAECLLMTCG